MTAGGTGYKKLPTARLASRFGSCIFNPMSKLGTVKASKRGRGSRSSRKRVRAEGFILPAEPLPSWREAKAGVERWMLREALRRTGGNMAAAGRLLGITKVAVLHAVRRHELEELVRAPE